MHFVSSFYQNFHTSRPLSGAGTMWGQYTCLCVLVFIPFLLTLLVGHNHSCSPHPENPVSFSWPPEDYNFKHHYLIERSSSEYWTVEIKLHYVFQKEKHGSKPEQEKIQTSSLKMGHERERGLKKDTTFYVLWPGQLGTSPSGDLGEMVRSHISLLLEGWESRVFIPQFPLVTTESWSWDTHMLP